MYYKTVLSRPYTLLDFVKENIFIFPNFWRILNFLANLRENKNKLVF